MVHICSTPTGVETPDVIDLRKSQRKESDKPLYQVFFPRKVAFVWQLDSLFEWNIVMLFVLLL
jgi:hypothetical protein